MKKGRGPQLSEKNKNPVINRIRFIAKQYGNAKINSYSESGTWRLYSEAYGTNALGAT